MDQRDREILAALEEGLPLVREPFGEIGRRIGLSEQDVLERIRELGATGIIRRFRVRINQRQLGIIANALVSRVHSGGKAAGTGRARKWTMS